jgi:plastocyanin
MKKGLLILFILSSFNSKGTIHQIQVWSGYMQFLPPNNIIVQLGDTIQWTPLDPPTMSHTITSNNIPTGAVPFDQIWQMPADTFFQYVPQVAGLYQYVCTPHIPNGMIGEFTVTIGANAKTYVPDDNFENYLEANGMGDGIALNDNILTSAIDTVTNLDVSFQNILDLTGIEDFTSLIDLPSGILENRSTVLAL